MMTEEKLEAYRRHMGEDEIPDLCEPTTKEFFVILGAAVGAVFIMTLLAIGAVYLAYNY